MSALQWTGSNLSQIKKFAGKDVRVLDAEPGPELYVYLSDDEQLVVAAGRWVVLSDDGSMTVAEVAP